MKSLMRLFRKNLNDYTLVGEIEKIVRLGADMTKREEWSPFRKLPDVSSVKVNLSPWDAITWMFGIRKRKLPAELIYKKYKNKKYNRYALHMIRRLKKMEGQYFWWYVDLLMRRSTVFFYLGLRHVYPKWHREIPLEKVLKLYKEYRKLTETIEEIDYRRVYISKGNGKYRPLGVPKPVWRIYLHLLNQFLVLKLDKTISENQHGFRPGKGTLTAWIEIIKNVKNYKYIYEFDYKGFFDSLKHNVIAASLRKVNVPNEVIQGLMHLNRSQPKLPKSEWLVDESQVYKQILSKEMNLSAYNLWLYRGVPQGSPTSPFLAILALDYATLKDKWFKDAKWIRYADDGIFMSNKEYDIKETVPLLKEYGIEYNWGKSGWVKKNNEWIKPLKFLGLSYDGKVWKAETRKGSHLIYDKESLLEAIEGGYLRNKYIKVPQHFEKFIQSSLKGFILSRMYIGSWNLEEYIQDFSLKYMKGSWLWKYYRWLRALESKGGDHKLLSQMLNIKVTVFNSSSLCIPSMIDILTEVRDNKGRKPKKWVRGDISTR